MSAPTAVAWTALPTLPRDECQLADKSWDVQVVLVEASEWGSGR